MLRPLGDGSRPPKKTLTAEQVGGDRGTSPCRIAAKRLTLTGGADRVGVRVPGDVGGDGGTYAHVAYVATPVHLATQTPLPPVNVTRANVDAV